MRYYVLGGSGFIGHVVVNKLLELGEEVVVIDCLSPYSEVYKKRRPPRHLRKNFKLRNYYVSYAIKNNPLRPSDVVIHLANTPNQAGFSNSPDGHYQSVFVDNMSTNQHVIEWCAVASARLVYVSSSMVYGNWTGSVSESVAPNPVNAYGRMKLCTENIITDSLHKYTIIRPTAVYGPNDSLGRVISLWVHDAKVGDPIYVDSPDAQLDFTHVDDTANGIVAAALANYYTQGVFNISAGRAWTLLDAAQLIVKTIGSKSEIICGKGLPPDMPRRGALDITKADSMLNYRPRIKFEDGIRTLL
jgi:nucleoside-diphosphate-sugar epimerase